MSVLDKETKIKFINLEIERILILKNIKELELKRLELEKELLTVKGLPIIKKSYIQKDKIYKSNIPDSIEKKDDFNLFSINNNSWLETKNTLHNSNLWSSKTNISNNSPFKINDQKKYNFCDLNINKSNNSPIKTNKKRKTWRKKSDFNGWVL